MDSMFTKKIYILPPLKAIISFILTLLTLLKKMTTEKIREGSTQWREPFLHTSIT